MEFLVAKNTKNDGGSMFFGEQKPLPGNRDNHTEVFEPILFNLAVQAMGPPKGGLIGPKNLGDFWVFSCFLMVF